MGIPAIVGLCLASFCLVLLIIALVQLNGLRSALSEIDHRVRHLQRGADDGGRVERTNTLLGNLLEQARRLDEAVAALRPAFSRQPLPPPPPPPSPPPPVEPTTAASEATGDREGEREGFTTRDFAPFRDEPPAAIRPSPTPASDPVAKPWVAPASEQSLAHTGASEPDAGLLGEYRGLIAQPRKTEINRWTDEHGGESCEATDDGTFRPLDREAGGLLVLLPLDGDRAMVVPAGRLVVDFATSFATSINLRSATRQTFELVEDGSGILRLVEPAYAERREGVWRLVAPGRLSGLNPG